MRIDPNSQHQDPNAHTEKRHLDLSNQPPFVLDNWLVEPAHLKLKKPGLELQLEPRVMKLLVTLSMAESDVVSRNDLLDSVWSDVVVGDDALTMAVSKLRRALGQRLDGSAFLETIPRVGYRLLPGRTRVVDDSRAPDTAPPLIVEDEADSKTPQGASLGPRHLLLAGLLLVVAAGLYWMRLPVVVAPSESVQPLPPTTHRLTAFTGLESQASFSPAARRVAFMRGREGEWSLSVLDLSTNNVTVIYDGPASSPCWSPVDQRIAFLRFSEGDWFLSLVSASGGPHEDLLAVDPSPMAGIDWSPDGRALAWSEYSYEVRTYSVREIDIESGTTRPLTTPPEDSLGDARPSYSPDGRLVAFTRGLRAHGRDLWLLNRQSLEIRKLTYGQRRFRGYDWRPDSSGLIAAMNPTGPFQLWSVPIKGGDPTWIPTPGEQVRYPTVAGSSVAYDSFSISSDLYEVAPGGVESRLEPPSSNGRESAPAWSPDGLRLAYASDRSGPTEIWLLDSDGRTRRISRLGASAIFSIAWSPDSSQLVASGILDQYQIFILDFRTGDSRTLSTPSDADSFGGVFSPDGLSVSFVSNASGRPEVWQLKLEPEAVSSQVTDFSASSVRFADDGTMYVLSGDELMMQDRNGSFHSEVTDFSPIMWSGSHLYGWLMRGRRAHAIISQGEQLQWVQWSLDTGVRSVVAAVEPPLDSSGFTVHPGEGMAVVARFLAPESDLRMMSLSLPGS